MYVSKELNVHLAFLVSFFKEPLYYFRTPPQPDDPDDGGHFVKRVHLSTHKSFIVFRVAACRSAHVYLADHSNRYRLVTIVLFLHAFIS